MMYNTFMNRKICEINTKMFNAIPSSADQMSLKKSLRTGQRVVLTYHLSSDVKKQITGIIIKITNKNKPYASMHILGGDVKIDRYEKVLCLYSPHVEIMQVFPCDEYKRADLTYLRYVNSIKSSI